MKEMPVSRSRITTSGDAAAVLLPGELLEELGLKVGDEVEVVVIEGTLVLRRTDEEERSRRVEESTQSVLQRRKSAFEELAKGVD
jgi:antitoxin component of MazEF toxin-antitoxin module